MVMKGEEPVRPQVELVRGWQGLSSKYFLFSYYVMYVLLFSVK